MHMYFSSYQNMKFEVRSFTNYKDTIGVKFQKAGHMTLTSPILRVVCNCKLWFDYDIVYLHAKSDNSSFKHSKGIIGSIKI